MKIIDFSGDFLSFVYQTKIKHFSKIPRDDTNVYIYFFEKLQNKLFNNTHTHTNTIISLHFLFDDVWKIENIALGCTHCCQLYKCAGNENKNGRVCVCVCCVWITRNQICRSVCCRQRRRTRRTTQTQTWIFHTKTLWRLYRASALHFHIQIIANTNTNDGDYLMKIFPTHTHSDGGAT